MERHGVGGEASPLVRTTWSLVDRCDTRGTEAARESLVRAFEMLQTRRDTRLEEATGSLPLIMWSVLLFGGVTIVVSSCLLGNEKQTVHGYHVMSLTVLMSVTLLVIKDLDRALNGATRISPLVFQRAQAEMNGLSH